jgi:RNA polymerase sigma-70 factor, ECF subfamily
VTRRAALPRSTIAARRPAGSRPNLLDPDRSPHAILGQEQGSAEAHTSDGRRLNPESLGSHLASLYRAAYGLCGSREDAEDLVQDTYEKVLRRPRVLRHDQDLAYLLRALRNTWISSRRSARPPAFPAGDWIDEIETPHDPISQVLAGAAVYTALQNITQPLREALVAVDILGLSYRDAAHALDTKEGTIMSRLHRGRGQIATRLGWDG